MFPTALADRRARRTWAGSIPSVFPGKCVEVAAELPDK